MEEQYVAAVIGGACAGSEIADRLRELGVLVFVFEQNDLPYGKIEDGLPRWHVKLQDKEKKGIDDKLQQPGVEFVPRCRLGADVTLESLREEWGIPLVVMANGAWRDRPLRLDGLEDIADRSFAYQNPFVYWFNHYHEPHFRGETYAIPPGPLVIGGGLASIDVAKICQFELTRAAARAHGKDIPLLDMEHYGILKAVEKAGLDPAILDFEPARLVYRKRVRDMPLVPLGESPTAEKLVKAEAVREKIIKNATTRYGFEVLELRTPLRVHTEGGSVRGLTVGKMAYSDGRFQPTGAEEFLPARLVISSIGSIPERLNGVPMRGELYDTGNPFTGEVNGFSGVYCVGNAITGRGNIRESSKNARRLGTLVAGALAAEEPDYEKLFQAQREEAAAHVTKLMTYLRAMPVLTADRREALLSRVKAMQAQRGYGEGYGAWRDRVLAAR